MMASVCSAQTPTKHVVHTGVNCGHNTWTIHNKKLVQQILNAKIGELFESKPFKMAQLLWTIRLYPNGNNNNSKGSVKIFLKLVQMPRVLDQIILSYTTTDPQSMASSTALDIYLKSGDSKGWLNRSLLLNEWKQLKPQLIQIVVSVNIFKVKFKKYAVNGILSHYRFNQNETFSIYRKKQKLIYKIDDHTLSKFKQSYYGKRYESAIFNHMWRLRWFPNGANHDCATFMSIYLVLCRIPFRMSQLTTKYKITCKELNRSISAVDDFSFAASNWGKSKFIALSDIVHLNTLTFIVDIEILNEIGGERDDCDIWDEEQIKYILGINHDDEEGDGDGDGDHDNMHKTDHDLCNLDQHDFESLFRIRSTPNQTINQSSSSPLQSPRNSSSPRHSRTQNIQQNIQKKDVKSLRKRITINQKTVESLTDKLNTLKCGLREEIKKRRHIIKIIHNKMTEIEEYMFDDDEKRQNMDNNHLSTQIGMIKKRLNELQTQMDGNCAKKMDESSKKKQLDSWLNEVVELPQYFENLVLNGFDDLESLKDLTKDYLEEIGIDKIGHQLKLLRFIRKIHETNNLKQNMNIIYDHDSPACAIDNCNENYNEDDHEFMIMTNNNAVNQNQQRIIQMNEGGPQQFNTL